MRHALFTALLILGAGLVACSSGLTEPPGDEEASRADVGAGFDAGADSGGATGEPAAEENLVEECGVTIDISSFDRFACNPFCQTGCDRSSGCYYDDPLVAGPTASCEERGSLGLGRVCEAGRCAPGLRCMAERGGEPRCERLCAPGGPDACPDGTICIGEPIGTCVETCRQGPEDDCPEGMACFPRPDGSGLATCWGINEDARHGDPCETRRDCGRAQICYDGDYATDSLRCRDLCGYGYDRCFQGQCYRLGIRDLPWDVQACI